MSATAAAKTVMEADQVTADVTVTDIMGGVHPAILTAERAVDSRGNARLITQKLLIRDIPLFDRLLAEVQVGDEISATIVTEWYEDDYASYLADFRRVALTDPAATARDLAAVP